LLKFVFSKLDTALLELTPFNMRVWVSGKRPIVRTQTKDED
jgi:hypothetical protein